MKRSISGIRGIVGTDLGLRDVMEFCGGFSGLVASKKCVIARDTRPSSQMIGMCASAALMQNGVDVLDLGIAPTPAVFYEARRYGAGLVVTASHNPVEWNGLKFVLDGRGIDRAELSAVTAKHDVRRGGIARETRIGTDYADAACGLVGRIEDPPTVTVDAGGGAAAALAPEFLKRLGCTVRVINRTLEESSRGPDPTTDDLSGLISASSGCDAGFAFDLDGDRLMVVKDGRKQPPDATLGLGVARALELGCKKFVLSMDTSVSVEKLIVRHGGSVARSPVGEANVTGLMRQTGSDAGGEGSSAGFILPGFNHCRDGILTSGLVASMLSSSTVDETLAFMGRYHQVRDKVPAHHTLHERILRAVERDLRDRSDAIDTSDGVKAVLDEDTWVLVRRSNTEDVIRISAESRSPERARCISGMVGDLVRGQ